MSRNYSNLDRETLSVNPCLICNNVYCHLRDKCKRRKYTDLNSVVYIPRPDKWENCVYFIGDK